MTWLEDWLETYRETYEDRYQQWCHEEELDPENLESTLMFEDHCRLMIRHQEWLEREERDR